MPAAVQACRKCRKLFNSLFSTELCPDCAKSEESALDRVKDYLWDHKGAHVPEVAAACDVTEKDLMKWLREDRIQVCEESVIKVYCENCGKPILSGKYCEACVMQMHGVLSEVARQSKKAEEEKRNAELEYKQNQKMRFVGKIKNIE